MKKRFMEIISLLMAFVMTFGLCVTALAADGEYTITIQNATIGETYSAYKIFDATYNENGGVSYTISKSSPLYESISELTDIFNLKAASVDADTYYVTVRDGVTDAEVIAAIEGLGIEKLVTASASETATKTTLTLDVGEPGYYYISTTTGSVVTITTTAPKATVVDKNSVVGEDLAKYIIDENGNVVQHGDAALGDELDFSISSGVPRYEGGDTVYEYQFTDTLSDSGMGIEISASSSGIHESDGHYYASEDLINQFVTFTDSSGNSYTLSEVAYNYTLEFTDVTYENGCYVCGGFILTYYTYEDESLSESKYPTDLTLDITYTVYVTDNANHFESNTALMNYWIQGPEGPEPGTNSGASSTDHVYEWDLKILKADGTESAEGTRLLEGATFTLYGTNLIDVNVRTDYTYTLMTTAEMVPGTTYYYLLKDGRWITSAPTEATREQYADEAGPYLREVSSSEIKEAGADYTVEGTTNSEGVVIFDGLTEGTYTITEIVAPDGYNLLDHTISITVAFDSDTGGFSVTSITGLTDDVSFDVNDELEIMIQNNAGTVLPGTGGIGTTIFYVVGSLLVLAAAAFALARLRLGKDR